jgi:hypothetical protein
MHIPLKDGDQSSTLWGITMKEYLYHPKPYSPHTPSPPFGRCEACGGLTVITKYIGDVITPMEIRCTVCNWQPEYDIVR